MILTEGGDIMNKKRNLKKHRVKKNEKILTLYNTETNGVDACCPSGQSGNCRC